jgi:ribose transport system substrate-binding protein
MRDSIAACRRRLRILAAALACALPVACACTPRRSAKALQIAMVTKALDSEWWQRVKAGAEEAARAVGDVKLVVLAPEREINIDQQVAILEDQIVKGVAAMAVAPAGVAEVIPVLEKSKAAGIPVLIFDTDVPWTGKLSFIGLDNRLGGRLAGEHIVRVLKGRGKVAVIRGVLGVATHEERVAGFREAIAEAPGIQLVSIQPANSERALGMAVMENLLTSHPDLRAVFATNDQMALGAVEAVAGRRLTGKIVVVGFDATYEAGRAVQAGLLSATLAGYPELMGKLAVEQAVKVARGPAHPAADRHPHCGGDRGERGRLFASRP